MEVDIDKFLLDRIEKKVERTINIWLFPLSAILIMGTVTILLSAVLLKMLIDNQNTIYPYLELLVLGSLFILLPAILVYTIMVLNDLRKVEKLITQAVMINRIKPRKR